MLERFAIEITIKRKKLLVSIPDWITDIANHFKTFESEERLVFDVPYNWSGLNDGTLFELLKVLGDGVYIALAYTAKGNEIVLDNNGDKVDQYTGTIDGKIVKKYVKKRIRIVDLLDAEKEIFSVVDYTLDLNYKECIVKTMELYCVGSLSNLKLKDFIKEEA